jgi:hypothetical protein
MVKTFHPEILWIHELSALLHLLTLFYRQKHYFETIDYKELATVYKHLFCIDSLCQTLYVYPVVKVQVELNDTPRAMAIYHPSDTTYLSASGNLLLSETLTLN